MKTINNIFSAAFFALVIGLVAAPTAFAQPANFDSQRMDRDLQIMERIFSDLQRTAMGSNSFFSGSSNSNNVTGSYFPGYGIVFNVDGNYTSGILTPAVVTGHGIRSAQRTTSRDLAEVLVDGYGTSQKNEKKAEEAVYEARIDSARTAQFGKQRDVIRDFFANYVDAIGQLTPNDRISILISQRGNGFQYVTVGQNMRLETNTLNPLRAEVKVSDVVAYRSGSISESEFNQRITFNELDTNAQNQKELTVMRGIFDSVLRKNESSKFSTTRDAQGVMLTNFGAMFSLDASVLSSSLVRMTGLVAPLENHIYTTGSRFTEVKSVEVKDGVATLILDDGTKVIMPNEKDVVTINGVSYNRKGERVSRSTVSGEYKITEVEEVDFEAELDKLVDQVADLVIDYGRTLRSLQSNDRILVSINTSSGKDSALPKRIEVQVDMSVLRSLESGSISREQARQRVNVREFS